MASWVAVADGWELEILRDKAVGSLRRAVGDGVRWAVMKLSWGGSESGGIGRCVVVIGESWLLDVSLTLTLSDEEGSLPSPLDDNISRWISRRSQNCSRCTTTWCEGEFSRNGIYGRLSPIYTSGLLRD